MRKLLFPAALFLALAVAASAQVPCELKLVNGPSFRGLKAGSFITYVEKNFEVKEKNDRGGNVTTGVVMFDDVEYALIFRNNILNTIVARYRRDTFDDVDEFAAALLSTLSLPDAWRKPTAQQIASTKRMKAAVKDLAEAEAKLATLEKTMTPEYIGVKQLKEKIKALEELRDASSINAREGRFMDCDGFSLDAVIDVEGVPVLTERIIPRKPAKNEFKP
jgi:hypothetical protein